jgi:hypothetical protein
MDNLQLERICVLHNHTRPYFGGVYSADTLPTAIDKYPTFYFCNTDLHNEKGTHWVLIYLSSDVGIPIYYDSLGKSPEEQNVLIRDFLIVNGPRYIINTTRHQNHNTNTCGMFCLFVADMLCKGLVFSEVINLFDPTHLVYNEIIVRGYVIDHMMVI